MNDPTPQSDPVDAAAEAEAFASSLERPKRTLFRRRPADESSVEETGVIVPDAPVAPVRQLFRRRPAGQPEVPAAADSQETQVISAADVVGAADPSLDEPLAAAAAADLPARSKLIRERRDHVEKRQDAVYHLGGLAFELHRRGSLPTRVMRLRADEIESIDERVRGIDADLGEIERQREVQKQARRDRQPRTRAAIVTPVGICAECGTGFDAKANFCANCGAKVEAPPVDSVETPVDEEATS